MGLESASTPTKTSSGKLNTEIESAIPQSNSPSQIVVHKDLENLAIKDNMHHQRLNEQTEAATLDDQENLIEAQSLRDRSSKSTRLGLAIFGAFALIIGKYGIPEVTVECVEDRVLNALQFANDFILKPGNEAFRDGFQILCSLIVDITCLITFIDWIRKGTSYRLPLTLTMFYLIRAIVQNMFISPFTKGYYWESPGIPSLVVPYGRGSDFFFSGHTGFMLICALEWHYNGMKKVRNFVVAGLIYTMLILLVYQIHYSIDLFAGAFFADWCFIKVDLYKHDIADKVKLVKDKIFLCFRGRYKTSYKGM